MKRLLKVGLLTLTGLSVTGGFFWMRSLASWRPQKIKALSRNYIPIYISRDGRFITAFSMKSTTAEPSSTYESFDLKTGRSKPWDSSNSIGEANSVGYGRSGDFYWSFRKTKDATYSLKLKDMATGQLKHTLTWGPREYDMSPAIAVVGQNLCVLSRYDFREYDLTTDNLKRRVTLQHPLASVVNFSTHFAISPDGKALYGCFGPNGAVWDAATGKRLKHWRVTGVPNPKNSFLFSPDGRIIAYPVFPSPSNSPIQYHFVDSTTGKLLWTDTFEDVEMKSHFSSQGSEIVIRRQNNCEVRDLSTGKLKRRLPGPRSSDGLLLRVTRDWIYTTNDAQQILRWRAR